MMPPALLACDWGSTNLRAWVLDEGGGLIARRSYPLGIASLGPGEARRRFMDDIRPDLGVDRVPAILCGMVGAKLGWDLAPYGPCPAGLDDLAPLLHHPEPGHPIRIVPGLRYQAAGGLYDVMRGEETMVLGWAELADPSPVPRLICQPGTHTKWMVLDQDRIIAFRTFMTGELYAVLSAHSLLRHAGASGDDTDFDAGCAAAGDGGGLAARLFTTRSRVVGGGQPIESTGGYLSGLLIGAEVAAAPTMMGVAEDTPVVLIGDALLCDRYARALDRRGIAVTRHEGEPAVRAGLFALARMGGLI